MCDLLVCAADEKILRILEPSNHFINYHNSLCESNLRLYLSDEERKLETQLIENENPLIYKTNVETGQETLGLLIKNMKVESKNLYFDETKNHVEEFINSFDENPSEDILNQKTLWPELNKLYGHGYELSTCTASCNGKLVVSACKSQRKETSCLIFWNPLEYKEIYRTECHGFTVFDVSFSKNNNVFASVSKDRQLSVHFSKKYISNNKPLFSNFDLDKIMSDFEAYNKKMKNNLEELEEDQIMVPLILKEVHSRAIYSLSVSASGKYIATGSRDKFLKIFCLISNDNTIEFSEHIKYKFKTPVHSVEFLDGNENVLLVGLESGEIHSVNITQSNINLYRSIITIHFRKRTTPWFESE